MLSCTTDPTGTARQNRYGWSRWHITWSMAMVVGLGLALVTPYTAQAKTFHCGAGDVHCLIGAIAEANTNGQGQNKIDLEEGTYTLTAIDHMSNGPTGLPSITGALTIQGAEADLTIIERAGSAPLFRLVHVAATGRLALEGLTLRGGSGETLSIGGGLFNSGGTVPLTESTIAGNSADIGGGLNNTGMLTLIQSTVADNSGCGLSNATGGTVTLTQSTVAGNSGCGLASNSGSVGMQNTILALNRPGQCFGQVISLDNNLIDDPTGCTIALQAHDLTGDPGLDAFTDDGTPGNGHFPLLATSRAINAGNAEVCPKTDQLGEHRDKPCDIGAIEFQGKAVSSR